MATTCDNCASLPTPPACGGLLTVPCSRAEPQECADVGHWSDDYLFSWSEDPSVQRFLDGRPQQQEQRA